MLAFDRIRDTSTSTGTGDFVPAGAPPATFFGFDTVPAAQTFDYVIAHRSANEVEIGRGSIASGKLVRTQVLGGSAGTGKVSFSAGVKDLFVTAAAASLNELAVQGYGRIPRFTQVEAGKGIGGDYGAAESGAGNVWGACIWGLNSTNYSGAGYGTGWSAGNLYGLAWMRSGHANAHAAIGEGAYLYTVGTLRGGIGTAGVATVDGTAAAPAYGFLADPGSGFYRVAAGAVGIAAAGVEAVRITAPSGVGRIGIGTAATWKLHLAEASSNAVVMCESRDPGGAFTYLQSNSSIDGRVGTLSNHPLALMVNGTVRGYATTWGLGLGGRLAVLAAASTGTPAGYAGDAILGRSATAGALYFGSDGNLQRYLYGIDAALVVGPAFTALRSANDNTATLGASGIAWSGIYSKTAVTVTSDEREKADIVDSPLGLDFVLRLRPVAFRLTEAECWEDEAGERRSRPGRRRHYGFLAQEVATALGDHAADCAIWSLADKADADSRQGLRIEQLVAPLTRAVQQLHERVQRLEALRAAEDAA